MLADLILGHAPIVAVEWDPYACAVLRERAADGWVPGLSVYEGDVRLFDPSKYTGRVDCIAAGFPCQDISVAGNGAGINGERSGLYREVLRVADVVRPRFVFLENSPAIVCNGLGTVLGDLAARGYNGRWTVLAAADVGAPHIRERWWGLFWRDADVLWDDLHHADPNETGVSCNRPECGGSIPEEWRCVCNSGNMGNPNRLRQLQPEGGQRHQRGWAGNSGWWSVEPRLDRVGYGVANRVDRIACIGNGQVPLCAAAAWKILGGP